VTRRYTSWKELAHGPPGHTARSTCMGHGVRCTCGAVLGGSIERAALRGRSFWPRMSEAVTSGNVVVALIYSDTCKRQ
jgi:hypothetical protein